MAKKFGELSKRTRIANRLKSSGSLSLTALGYVLGMKPEEDDDDYGMSGFGGSGDEDGSEIPRQSSRPSRMRSSESSPRESVQSSLGGNQAILLLEQIVLQLQGMRTDSRRHSDVIRGIAQDTKESAERNSERSGLAADPFADNSDSPDGSGSNTVGGKGGKSLIDRLAPGLPGAFGGLSSIVKSVAGKFLPLAAAIGGSVGLTTAIVGVTAAGAVAFTAWQLVKNAMKSHQLLNEYKDEGRRGVAEDEAKNSGIATVDEAGNPKTTGQLAKEIANKAQMSGEIGDDDWKSMGVTRHKKDEGFTEEDAGKYLEWRQTKRNETRSGRKGLPAAIEASLVGPARVSKPKSSTTSSSVTPESFAPRTGGVVEGSGIEYDSLPESSRNRPSIGNVSSSPVRLSSELHISEEGIQAIKDREGIRKTPYWDEGSWAIGHGDHNYHGKPIGDDPTMFGGYNPKTLSAKNPTIRLTEPEADAAIRVRAVEFEEKVKSTLKEPVTQSQFDSLVSVAYNKGNADDLTRKINRGEKLTAKDFTSSANVRDKRTGKLVPHAGLRERRLQEYAQFSASLAPQRAAAPLQTASTQLAQNQKTAAALNLMMMGGNKTTVVNTQTLPPVMVRPRNDNNTTLAALTYVNAT
tara:strand:- start:1288 stop:3189 length:1902 start_codon:yes stop_codon:yes gene_type:complete